MMNHLLVQSLSNYGVGTTGEVPRQTQHLRGCNRMSRPNSASACFRHVEETLGLCASIRSMRCSTTVPRSGIVWMLPQLILQAMELMRPSQCMSLHNFEPM